MKVNYNANEDTLSILFRDAPIEASETHHTGLMIDYDRNGQIVGLEIAPASAYLSCSATFPLVEFRTLGFKPEKVSSNENPPDTVR